MRFCDMKISFYGWSMQSCPHCNTELSLQLLREGGYCPKCGELIMPYEDPAEDEPIEIDCPSLDDEEEALPTDITEVGLEVDTGDSDDAEKSLPEDGAPADVPDKTESGLPEPVVVGDESAPE